MSDFIHGTYLVDASKSDCLVVLELSILHSASAGRKSQGQPHQCNRFGWSEGQGRSESSLIVGDYFRLISAAEVMIQDM